MKTMTIYGCRMPGDVTALLLERWPEPQTMSIDGREYECDTNIEWAVRVSDNGELIRDSRGMISLRVGELRYSANNLLALANLELAAFSLMA